MKKSPNLISLSEQKMLMMITSLQLMKIQVCHTYMVSKRTLLNVLNCFHVADGLSSDLAHDLFEGFAVDIVSRLIVSFIREGLFDLDGLNEIILNFAHSESGKNHKLQLVKVKPLNSLKVKQTACEMWSLIKLDFYL